MVFDSFVSRSLDSNYFREDILEFGPHFCVILIEEESKSKLSVSRHLPSLQDRKDRKREWEGGRH